MFWIVKILFVSNFILKEPLSLIYTYHYQSCHHSSAENFTYQLELKENQTFYFRRMVTHSGLRSKANNDFVSGSYSISNDTLVLTPSLTTHKLVDEKESLSYLMKDDNLGLVNNFALTILPCQFQKSEKPIFFDKGPTLLPVD